MAKFPSWMKMAKDPSSVGASFLNVFGITFEEFKEEMDYVVNNFYIKTADVEMVDILYKVPLTLDVVNDFNKGNFPEIVLNHHTGDVERISHVPLVKDLYSRDRALPLAFINGEDHYLYLRIDMTKIADRETPFQSVEINGAKHYTVEFHHVWNAFDEFGFLLGLKRLPLEKNESYKQRILDVFINPGSSTNQGIQSGLSRELGLKSNEIKVFSLDDEAFSEELIDTKGAPTKKMRQYAKSINESLKFTIDTLNLGEAYWYSLEEENMGIHFLPHIWDIDSSLFRSEEFQSGIGFGDDLKVNGPNIDESTIRNFRLNLSLVGYYENFETFFPEMSFEYKIYAKGKILENNYEEEEFKYTIEAAEVFKQDYSVRASQDFNYLHQVMFDNKNDFIKTSDLDFIHFGKSNEFLNKQTDNLLRLSLYLTGTNPLESSKISNLAVIWEDTTGKEHAYRFDSREKWIHSQTNSNGQPTSTIETSRTYYDRTTNQLELGQGNFKEEISTSADFMRGRYDTNFVLVKNGELSLNFDTINQFMN